LRGHRKKQVVILTQGIGEIEDIFGRISDVIDAELNK
jgi:hypothetical protein